ncbi:MAG: hypothetical protein R3F11_24165 [Verrucomicrobiales bacterium]
MNVLWKRWGKTSLVLGSIVAGIAGGSWVWQEQFERFPALRLPDAMMLKEARLRMAERDIEAAAMAIEAFAAHYGTLPFSKQTSEEQFATTLGHELNGVRPGTSGKNREAIVFWEVPAGEQIDPWGNRYHFALDHDNDGVVNPGADPINRDFAIWSDGPNGIDEHGGGDDIKSW